MEPARSTGSSRSSLHTPYKCDLANLLTGEPCEAAYTRAWNLKRHQVVDHRMQVFQGHGPSRSENSSIMHSPDMHRQPRTTLPIDSSRQSRGSTLLSPRSRSNGDIGILSADLRENGSARLEARLQRLVNQDNSRIFSR